MEVKALNVMNNEFAGDSPTLICVYECSDPWAHRMFSSIATAMQDEKRKARVENMLEKIRFVELHDKLARRLIQEAREHYKMTGNEKYNVQFSPAWFDATTYDVLSQAREPFLKQRFGIKGLTG